MPSSVTARSHAFRPRPSCSRPCGGLSRRAALRALPVWDPERNPRSGAGNGYMGWRRVVGVDPADSRLKAPSLFTEFAGRSFPDARRIDLRSFYHVAVDGPLAQRAMRDHEAHKAALIALGRPLKAGDYLVLVAANLATKEIDNWVWATFWWHDPAGRRSIRGGSPGSLGNRLAPLPDAGFI